MDTLAYKAYWHDVTKEVIPESRTDWQPGDRAIFEKTKEAALIVIINNIETDYEYDVAAIEVSAQKDGIFPIIVCGCGYMGCGGAYVEVSQNEEGIVWKRFWQGQCGGEPLPEDDLKGLKAVATKNIYIKPPLRFPRRHYEAVIKNLLNELRRHEDSFTYREYQKSLEQYKTGNMARC